MLRVCWAGCGFLLMFSVEMLDCILHFYWILAIRENSDEFEREKWCSCFVTI